MNAPTTPEAARKPSWPFAIGAIPLLILNLVLRPPEGGVSGRGAEFVTGYFLGAAAVLLLIVALVYGVARLVRRHKSPPRVTATAFWTLLILAGLDLLSSIGGRAARTSSVPITGDERQGLRIESDSIRHPGFGFSMPSPGPSFLPSPELQAQMDARLSEHPDMVAWVLRNSDAHASLIIQLVKFSFLDEGRFRTFTQDLRHAAPASSGATVLSDSVLWEPPAGDYHLTIHHSSGLFLQTRCISRSRPNGYFILCVQTAAADSSSLAFVRNGLNMRR